MANKAQPNEPLSPHPEPPDRLAEQELPLKQMDGPWYRLHSSSRQALYFGCSGTNRFDAPNKEYGILYVGVDEYGPFIESFGRTHGKRGVELSLLKTKSLSRLESDRTLSLVDMTGKGLVLLGADARLASGDYRVAQRWAQALWQHPSEPDGLLYHSRHDDERVCCAIFDRASKHLSEHNLGSLIDPQNTQLLATLLNHYEFALL
jgi:RES domain